MCGTLLHKNLIWANRNPQLSVRLFIACLLFFLIHASLCHAQHAQAPQQFKAIHWSLDDGLSQEETYSIHKSAGGFLWVGTRNGLNRFDGFTIKAYYEDTTKSNALIGNDVMALVEDSLHHIWIGTNNGLSRYDSRADTFTKFLPSNDSFGIIIPFWATSNEVLCMEKDAWITAYNVHTLNKRKLTALSRFISNPWQQGTSIYDASSNSVWAILHADSLIQISLSTGNITGYGWIPYKKNGLRTDAEDMVYDSRRNCIWINSGDGLLCFTLHDKKFHRIGVFDEWIKSKDYDRWVGVDLDTQGQVWLATVPKGIIIYNPADGSVKPLFADNPDLQKTVAEGNMRIYCDKEGIVWLSYWLRKGFYQLNPVSQAVTRYNIDTAKSSPLYSNDVFNCTYAGNGKLWIGTGRGLYVFDAYSRVLQPSRKSIDGLILHIDTAKKRALIEDGRHFKEVDMRTLQDKPIILDDTGFYRAPDNTNKYLSAVPYKDGYILRTIYNEQVHFFFWRGSDAVAKKILAFPLANVVGHFFNTDGEKYLFLLSTTAGTTLTYTLENGRWVKKSTPLDSVKPRALYYNVQDGTYWLTAGNQLMRYSSDFRLIRRYIAEDVSSADAIHSILPDTYGNIWFHTDRFIYTLDVVKGRFYRLQERDGFQKQNFTPPFLPGSDNLGNLYFPSGWQYGEGFDLVSPDKLRNVYPHASVYIQNLEVAQKPYASRLGVNGISSLSLKHFQNAIVIQTGILDFYSKGKGRIRYKLDGVNNDWQYAPAYYTIRYDGLAPGNYKLLIQASNAVGDFNGPINSLQIGIAPPLWGTWWFQIIAAVVIVAVVYGVMRWRLHHLYQHRLQQSVKEKQLAELQRQKTDLEMQAMRAQMNPHFIFNSLNSINRFILQNNREQASDYLIKFSRLVRLILQHSQESLISLENELEALRLYLELEALRFNYHFSYKISLPEDVDAALIKVPPLIVQPYVENAIWHGLMHKEEQGQLDIDLSHEAGFLYFKITDNGIGRQQAALLRTKSATRHESVGHKITTHRIALMQQAAAKEPFVFINDLMDANGCAAGTEVLIKMPLLYD